MGSKRSSHVLSPIDPVQILREGARTTTGPVPELDVRTCSIGTRIWRHKRWLWVGLSEGDVFVALAVVKTGYAANAFVLVQRRDRPGFVFERSALGGPWAGEVTTSLHERSVLALFRAGGLEVEIGRSGATDAMYVRAVMRGFSLEATIDPSSAPALALTAPVGGTSVSTTEKRLLLPIRGAVRIGDAEHVLDDGCAGYDYTSGLLPRHTQWRWGFGMGSAGGSPFGFNLTSGFVGAAECAAFRSDGPRALAEPAFALDLADPQTPWTVRGEDVDLRFTPRAVHAKRTRLGLVRADFLQLLGTWDGRVRVDGRDLELRALPGVAEHQDVLW